MTDWNRFADTPTNELIKLIQKRNELNHESISRAAFQAFVFRFMKEVTHKCEILCKNWGYTKEDALEVSTRVFKRFWKYPKFDISKASNRDIDIAVILYLFRFAQTILVDFHKEQIGIHATPYDGSETIIFDFPPENDNDQLNILEPNSHINVVKKALSNLSDKHKVIFLTYKAYEYDGHKLPRHLLNALRTELGLSSQATIRSYKNEAYNKVNEYLELYGFKKRN